ALDDVPGSGLVLHMALVEPHVYLDPPGADNGERNFYCTMRDMLPSYAGSTLSITNGQTLSFSQTGTLDPSWVDVYAVVWVQDNSNKAVLQAASSLPVPDFSFFYGAEQSAAVSGFSLYSFDSELQNRGLQSDTYLIHVDWNLPAGWGGGVCEGGVCHQIGDNDFTIRLGGGLVEPITADIEPYGVWGEGTCTVTVTSQADPALIWSERYKIVTYNVPILCVDDDGGDLYEAYYHDAIDAAGYLRATWDRTAEGKLDASFLDHFHTVVWNVGWGFPSLDADDRAALTAYLDNGGRLFVTGQDIGWDFFDTSGSQYGSAAITWYRTYLGATYVMDDTNLLNVSGVASDPVGDGMSFAIAGGTGANNQQYPSEINPYGDGIGCFYYTTGREAGTRIDNGTFKSVYLAFGFEGIATETDRNLLMARVLDYFGTGLSATPAEELSRPMLAGPVRANPNPFNPVTNIQFSVEGNGPAPLEVAVYDLRGNLVRSLWRGVVLPGEQSVRWNGRDDGGSQTASGIYLARVKYGETERAIKLTLTK
ncbi:MAG: FlgD immunoglobulin-like domain containing protein, partial [bacterium]